MTTNEKELIDLAVEGDKNALETLIISVQDLIYNLSIRMVGSIHDAEDATQEIMIRIITHLSGFRKESAFSTWVYRIAVNYLINYKKSMFTQHPLSFEYYKEDIEAGFIENNPELLHNVDENILTEELKLSCTNVMLQCFDAESRCIYILGTMFKLDSKIAGEILDLSPEAFRQRLSRVRKKMAGFLKNYCGLVGGKCNCQKRVGYAIKSHRLDPSHLEYSELQELDNAMLFDYTESMEHIDSLSLIFTDLPKYKAPQCAKEFITKLLNSGEMRFIQGYRESACL
jgi:RNA polymerase sigma factor (sigma-70 family)